jgi:hypothetical protein
MISYGDLEVPPPPFEPAAPSPELPELPAPVEPEPLEVLEPAPDAKLAILDSYRRKRDGDDGPSGAA